MPPAHNLKNIRGLNSPFKSNPFSFARKGHFYFPYPRNGIPGLKDVTSVIRDEEKSKEINSEAMNKVMKF